MSAGVDEWLRESVAPWRFIRDGRTRFAPGIRDLTGVIYDGLSPDAKQAMFPERRQPRAKDKPVIR